MDVNLMEVVSFYDPNPEFPSVAHDLDGQKTTLNEALRRIDMDGKGTAEVVAGSNCIILKPKWLTGLTKETVVVWFWRLKR